MAGLRLVHPQDPGERAQHALGHAAEVPAFHPGVVRRAHPGELGDLLAPQPGDPALAAEHRHPGLLGGQARPHPREELLHVGAEVHAVDGSPPSHPGGSVCGWPPAGDNGSDSHPDRRRPYRRGVPTTLTLNNGVEMPAVGLGVFQTPPDVTTGAVEEALRVGYRHVDTAAAYGNEREVGEGVRRSGVARDEVFVETKVWISDYGDDATLHAFDKSAAKLGVDRLDLLILHQPLTSRFDLTLDAYRALEQLLADGRVRAIGVSNFMPEHLDRLLEETSVVPAVNQIELHPYFQQTALQRVHAEHGIVTQAWSPIGGITSYGGAQKSTFDDPVLVGIAQQHGRSTAQVMLRWHLQRGRSVIPKSTRPARIAENFAVSDFALTTDQLDAIDALDTGVRGGPEPDSITLESYGRPIPEA